MKNVNRQKAIEFYHAFDKFGENIENQAEAIKSFQEMADRCLEMKEFIQSLSAQEFAELSKLDL